MHVQPGIFSKTNALRLIPGHVLVHTHILAKCKNCKIDVFVVIMPNNVNTEWILGGKMLLGGGDIPGLPPCMNLCMTSGDERWCVCKCICNTINH